MLTISERATFDDIDALGQSITSQMVTPQTPGVAPAAQIPIVQLGPVNLIAANLAPIGGLTAAIRTPSRVVNVIQVPNGIFQGSMDKSDFDQGATIIFSAPGYLPIQVPASQIACNTGARDVNGNVVMMTSNPCTTNSFTLTSSMPVGVPPTQNVSPYGQPYPYMPVAPPGYAPYPYQEPPHQSSWDLPAPDRAPRPQAKRKAPKAAPDEAQAPATPSVAPTMLETIPTMYLVGGGVLLALAAGYFFFRS